jgi:hypothetical protein
MLVGHFEKLVNGVPVVQVFAQHCGFGIPDSPFGNILMKFLYAGDLL